MGQTHTTPPAAQAPLRVRGGQAGISPLGKEGRSRSSPLLTKRRYEIEVAVDKDPRAACWRQELNGMWIRAALIAYVFHVEREILSEFM